ncbi:MAG: type I toxin-antitoxin system SymE family toxin [Gammaproteobacteria bacterium]|nr:type I toxin-antitoxin system SymE family toxin [Gammaproteobacteria bacterium]
MLKGKWLAQAGFQAGENVSVRVMHHCIVIIKNE